jgi:hypothetical protein
VVLTADGMLYVVTTLGGDPRPGGVLVETFSSDGQALATRALPVEGMTTASTTGALECGGKVWVIVAELSAAVGGQAIRAFPMEPTGPVPVPGPGRFSHRPWRGLSSTTVSR